MGDIHEIAIIKYEHWRLNHHKTPQRSGTIPRSSPVSTSVYTTLACCLSVPQQCECLAFQPNFISQSISQWISRIRNQWSFNQSVSSGILGNVYIGKENGKYSFMVFIALVGHMQSFIIQQWQHVLVILAGHDIPHFSLQLTQIPLQQWPNSKTTIMSPNPPPCRIIVVPIHRQRSKGR